MNSTCNTCRWVVVHTCMCDTSIIIYVTTMDFVNLSNINISIHCKHKKSMYFSFSCEYMYACTGNVKYYVH